MDLRNRKNEFAPRPDLKIWLDGELVPAGEAKISVFDHGLLYGDGVFEGIRSYNGKIFRCEQHVRRLYDSARAIRLVIPMTPDEITKAMYDTLAGNGLAGKDAYIRLVVTRGVGTLGLSILKTACPSVFVIADQIELYPPALYETGMAVITVPTMRSHPAALSPRIKSLNYLNNILAKIEGQDANAPEAIMLNHLGFVAECTGDNIFVIRDGKLQTPPTSAGILEGVTRDAVIELARKRGMTVEEKDLVRHDLYVVQECFLTGTAAEVIAVTSIDGRPIGDGKPGPITKQLMSDFHALIRAE
ncbi:MAG: branched-chain-amino-acid transaminase [Phycisphaerae bacterium]|nr:branched-chain-amino-acid transaminase [Phycisphaerae bacterium]